MTVSRTCFILSLSLIVVVVVDGAWPYDHGLCQLGRWKCWNSLKCIPQDWRCDGVTDCDDKSDEIGCDVYTVTITPTPAMETGAKNHASSTPRPQTSGDKSDGTTETESYRVSVDPSASTDAGSMSDKTAVTTFKADVTTPKTDVTSPKTDESTPKTDVTTPKTDVTTPKTDETTPKTDVTTPKTDVTTPKTDVKTPKTDVTTPKTDETTPKTDVTTPKTDVTPPKTDVSTPKTHVTTPETDVASPDVTSPDVTPPDVTPPVVSGNGGGVGSWSDWSECSAACGGGIRFRDCSDCNVSREVERCNTYPCEEEVHLSATEESTDAAIDDVEPKTRDEDTSECNLDCDGGHDEACSRCVCGSQVLFIFVTSAQESKIVGAAVFVAPKGDVLIAESNAEGWIMLVGLCPSDQNLIIHKNGYDDYYLLKDTKVKRTGYSAVIVNLKENKQFFTAPKTPSSLWRGIIQVTNMEYVSSLANPYSVERQALYQLFNRELYRFFSEFRVKVRDIYFIDPAMYRKKYNGGVAAKEDTEEDTKEDTTMDFSKTSTSKEQETVYTNSTGIIIQFQVIVTPGEDPHKLEGRIKDVADRGYLTSSIFLTKYFYKWYQIEESTHHATEPTEDPASLTSKIDNGCVNIWGDENCQWFADKYTSRFMVWCADRATSDSKCKKLCGNCGHGSPLEPTTVPLDRPIIGDSATAESNEVKDDDLCECKKKKFLTDKIFISELEETGGPKAVTLDSSTSVPSISASTDSGNAVATVTDSGNAVATVTDSRNAATAVVNPKEVTVTTTTDSPSPSTGYDMGSNTESAIPCVSGNYTNQLRTTSFTVPTTSEWAWTGTDSPVGSTASSVENTVSSVENTASSVENTASSVENTASSIESTASSVENTASSVENTASSVKNTVSSVENTASSVENTASSVENTASSVENTSSSVESTASSVKNTFANPTEGESNLGEISTSSFKKTDNNDANSTIKKVWSKSSSAGKSRATLAYTNSKGTKFIVPATKTGSFRTVDYFTSEDSGNSDDQLKEVTSGVSKTGEDNPKSPEQPSGPLYTTKHKVVTPLETEGISTKLKQTTDSVTNMQTTESSEPSTSSSFGNTGSPRSVGITRQYITYKGTASNTNHKPTTTPETPEIESNTPDFITETGVEKLVTYNTVNDTTSEKPSESEKTQGTARPKIPDVTDALTRTEPTKNELNPAEVRSVSSGYDTTFTSLPYTSSSYTPTTEQVITESFEAFSVTLSTESVSLDRQSSDVRTEADGGGDVEGESRETPPISTQHQEGDIKTDGEISQTVWKTKPFSFSKALKTTAAASEELRTTVNIGTTQNIGTTAKLGTTDKLGTTSDIGTTKNIETTDDMESTEKIGTTYRIGTTDDIGTTRTLGSDDVSPTSNGDVLPTGQADDSTADCVDRSPLEECLSWRESGFCESVTFIQQECRSTCNKCNLETEVQTQSGLKTMTPSDPATVSSHTEKSEESFGPTMPLTITPEATTSGCSKKCEVGSVPDETCSICTCTQPAKSYYILVVNHSHRPLPDTEVYREEEGGRRVPLGKSDVNGRLDVSLQPSCGVDIVLIKSPLYLEKRIRVKPKKSASYVKVFLQIDGSVRCPANDNSFCGDIETSGCSSDDECKEEQKCCLENCVYKCLPIGYLT